MRISAVQLRGFAKIATAMGKPLKSADEGSTRDNTHRRKLPIAQACRKRAMERGESG